MDMDEDEYQVINQMDQIIPNLWIGSLQATKDVESLRENNIHSVLSAMRGTVKIHEVCHADYRTLTMTRSYTLKDLPSFPSTVG